MLFSTTSINIVFVIVLQLLEVKTSELQLITQRRLWRPLEGSSRSPLKLRDLGMRCC